MSCATLISFIRINLHQYLIANELRNPADSNQGFYFSKWIFIQNMEFSQEYGSNQVDMVFPLYIQLELI